MWTFFGTYLCLLSVTLDSVLANNTSAEWSKWTSYGDCSRPCGGGLANRTRTCLGATHTCTGQNIRYKVCNTQACDNGNMFVRDIQCHSYNNVSIKDNYFHWVPYYSAPEPCVLYCKTVETEFILKMAGQAWNGTSCETNDERGVCIAGICKRVGCDDIVGSKRKLDPCGVCDGDGKSCGTPRGHRRRHSGLGETLFQWDVSWSSCSKTCGTGIQTSSVTCRDVNSGNVVENQFCARVIKPDPPRVKECVESSSCLYRWHTSKWGSCSRTCGEGSRYRRVLCLKHRHGNRTHVPDRKCSDVKPETKAPCNFGDCPEWLTGPWSACSVSCGYGEQKRKVVCRASSADSCVSEHKPAALQKCFAGKSCVSDGDIQQDGKSYSSASEQHDFFDDAMLQELSTIPRFQVLNWGPCSVTCGVGYRHREVTCSKGGQLVPLSECAGIEPHSKKECREKDCPLTMTSNTAFTWKHRKFKPCSQTCGKGTQTSILECLETAGNRTVVDSLCNGLVKPAPTTQYCNTVDCPPTWKVSEYGPCSVPCGGGRQSRNVECMQTTAHGDQETLLMYRCPDPVPLSERSCNLKYCQGEWNTGAWGECSVTCGMGMEYRSVYCVKQLKTALHVNVSDSDCIESRPSSSRQCHLGDCYKLQQLPEIRETNGTFIQIKRTKRIKLFVGENAILLPHQSVKIKCPVKNYNKKLIFWTKNHRLIPLVGRVRVSSNGALRLTRANPKTDAGMYTCSVGLLYAYVNVSFQSKREAKMQANKILDAIFHSNFNGSLINRPQSDGVKNISMTNSKFFKINSIQDNSEYDYSSYTTTNWTECDKQCGWGNQIRLVTCSQVTDKFIRLLPDEECMKKGLSRPSSERKCMLEPECPQWVVGDWSPCSDNTCLKSNYSVQTRPLGCRYSNGTITKFSNCDSKHQPPNEQHCTNTNCSAVWQTSSWSECTPRCGIKGQKLRTMSCVWVSTKQPAFEMCRELPKPSVSKPCKPAPCRHTTCEDSSPYCELAGQLKMCRYHKFRRRCCKTCKQANIS